MTTGCHLFNVRPLFRRVLFIARRVANKKVHIGTLKSRRGPGWLAWLSWFRCCWLAEARLTVGVLAIYFAQANVNKVCIVSPKRSKDIYLCTHARDPQPALVKRVGSYIFIPFFSLRPLSYLELRASSSSSSSVIFQRRLGLGPEVSYTVIRDESGGIMCRLTRIECGLRSVYSSTARERQFQRGRGTMCLAWKFLHPVENCRFIGR